MDIIIFMLLCLALFNQGVGAIHIDSDKDAKRILYIGTIVLCPFYAVFCAFVIKYCWLLAFGSSISLTQAGAMLLLTYTLIPFTVNKTVFQDHHFKR